MNAIPIILITAACFLAAILNLSLENRWRGRIMGIFTTLSIVLGIIFYGYGLTYALGASPATALRSVLTVCRMFSGVNDLGTIANAPGMKNVWVLTVFWAMHFMAFYVTASAAIATIGGKVLRRIRVTLLRKGTLLIIYGINKNSIEYARRQIHVLHRSVVFIDQADGSQEAAVNGIGGVVEKNGEHPDAALLHRLGIRAGNRRIEIAALHDDSFKNTIFVQTLLDAFEKAGIHPDQTALLVQGMDEEQAALLVSAENTYGYGNVLSFDEYELAARLLVQELPPCEVIRFDENARALNDLGVLMVGFGRMGRAALNHLLMNGQFCGSTFRADIFDVKAQNGILHKHEIFRHYDVRFHAADGKSEALYAFLEERGDAVRYIVLCTGNEKENRDIAQDLSHWMKEHGLSPAIIQCTTRGLVITAPGKQTPRYHGIYSSDILDIDRIDRMAMVVNQTYCSNQDKTPQENWRNCSYFSRMSSRASADFYPAVLKAAGKTVEQVCSGSWPPSGEMLENLSITEHMRWCAFHFVMGFRAMTEEEYAHRAALYRRDIQEKGASGLRIGKDMEHKKHACLIPWEDLDELSRRENAVTGGCVNYKQADRNNILDLPKVLNILKEFPE